MIGFSKFSAVTLGVFNSEVNETILSSSLAAAKAKCKVNVAGYLYTAATTDTVPDFTSKTWTVSTDGDTVNQSYAKRGTETWKCSADGEEDWSRCTKDDCSTVENKKAALGAVKSGTKCWVPQVKNTNFTDKHTFIGEATSLECKEDGKTCSANAEKCKYECAAGVLKTGGPTCVDKCGANAEFQLKDHEDNVLTNDSDFKANGECKEGHSLFSIVVLKCESKKIEVSKVEGGVISDQHELKNGALTKNDNLSKDVSVEDMKKCHESEKLCAFLSKTGCVHTDFKDKCVVEEDKCVEKKSFFATPFGVVLLCFFGCLLLACCIFGGKAAWKKFKKGDGYQNLDTN
jgi:hypothetical protein